MAIQEVLAEFRLRGPPLPSVPARDLYPGKSFRRVAEPEAPANLLDVDAEDFGHLVHIEEFAIFGEDVVNPAIGGSVL